MFNSFFQKIADTLTYFINDVKESILNFFDSIFFSVKNFFRKVLSFFAPIIGFFKNVYYGVSNFLSPIGNFFSKTIGAAFRKLFKTNIYNLETFRLIVKTKKRFISLVLIVLIGVSFMMGLLSTPDIMRKSMDVENDAYNLQDIQLYSLFGFCDEDIKKIKNATGIEYVLGSKQFDAYYKNSNDTNSVARICEVERDVNKFKLESGRLPEKKYECVLLGKEDESFYKIGDQIKFFLEDSSINSQLDVNNYTVVGFVTSPEYGTVLPGTSNLSNLPINNIVYIPNENFTSDYYTTVYLTLSGARDLVSYSKEYNNFIAENTVYVENVANAQQNYLKGKIIEEATKQLEDAQIKLVEARADGEFQLAQAKQQLDDANIQLVNFETEISMLEALLSKAQTAVQPYVDQAVETHDRYDDFFSRFGINIDYVYDTYMKKDVEANYNEIKSQYDSMKYQIANARKQYEDGLAQYNNGVKEFNEQMQEAEVQIRKAQQNLNELPEAKWIILDRSTHYTSYMYENNCNQMQSIAYVMPFIFFLVAALVCVTTMTRLIDEQRGQIGTFVALGYSDKQIIGKYLTYSFFASMIGSLVGVFIGQAIFPTVIYTCWKLMYKLPPIKILFPIGDLLISISCFTILIMSITAYVLYQTIKDVPSSLMRPKAPKSAKPILLEKATFIWNHLSFTSKITARNLFRYKARFLMTVIGVAGCTGLLVIGWGIKDSINDVIVKQYSDIFKYNYQINLSDDNNIEYNVSKLIENPKNEIVAPLCNYISTAYFGDEEETINAYILDQRDINTAFSFRKQDRRTAFKADNSGAVVSEKFAKNHNLKAGDSLTISSKSGIKQIVKISEICEMYFEHYVFMTTDYYENIYDETVHMNTIGVSSQDYDALQYDTEVLKDFSSINSFDMLIDVFTTMISALDLIIVVIIITAGSLAFVVIYNLSQVNISERIREIASLKVLGFHNGEVNTYIFKEIIILTIIGGLIGLPLGVIEHHFVMNVIDMEMITFGMDLSVLTFVRAYAITIVFTLIVLLFMRKPLRNVDMIESLKSVE